MSKDEPKKKRGCNYTPSEKETLLTIVKRYIHIIENKETTGNIINKKKRTWNIIANEYNANAITGCRTWAQLRHLYENIKQRTKKNILAQENRERKIQQIKMKASYDIKQIIRTGTGGAYKSVLSETDNQILALVAPQLKPLESLYDDAAKYFGDVNEGQYEPTPSSTQPCFEEVLIKPDEDQYPEPIDDVEEIPVGLVGTMSPADHPISNNEEGSTKKIKHSKISNMEQYFKMKLSNAKLERKFLIQRHKLEMELLRTKIKKITSAAKHTRSS